MAITFQLQDVQFRLDQKRRIKSWIRKILRGNGKKERDLNFVFTSDEKLHEFNVQFLHHDTYTDIITFDNSEGQYVAGDIMISIDRVQENAGKYGVSFVHELHRVMIHGILHLCGYKDKTETEKDLMRRKEDEALEVLRRLP